MTKRRRRFQSNTVRRIEAELRFGDGGSSLSTRKFRLELKLQSVHFLLRIITFRSELSIQHNPKQSNAKSLILSKMID